MEKLSVEKLICNETLKETRVEGKCMKYNKCGEEVKWIWVFLLINFKCNRQAMNGMGNDDKSCQCLFVDLLFLFSSVEFVLFVFFSVITRVCAFGCVYGRSEWWRKRSVFVLLLLLLLLQFKINGASCFCGVFLFAL